MPAEAKQPEIVITTDRARALIEVVMAWRSAHPDKTRYPMPLALGDKEAFLATVKLLSLIEYDEVSMKDVARLFTVSPYKSVQRDSWGDVRRWATPYLSPQPLLMCLRVRHTVR
jgi:hypothetical protein